LSIVSTVVKSGRTLGMTFASIWFIATGLFPFLNVSIPYRTPALALVALVAGVLLFLGK
jgi:hypothetical protein